MSSQRAYVRSSIIVALIAAVSTIAVSYITSYAKLGSLFRGEKSADILILPFTEIVRCSNTKINYESFLQYEIKSVNPDIEVIFLKSIGTRNKALPQLQELAKKYKSDIIIHGAIEERCEWDTINIRISYYTSYQDNIMPPYSKSYQLNSLLDSGDIMNEIDSLIVRKK